MLPTRSVRLAVVAGSVLAVACGDVTRPKATYANALSSYTLYTFTAAPATAPNALNFLGGSTHADSIASSSTSHSTSSATGKPIVYPVARHRRRARRHARSASASRW